MVGVDWEFEAVSASAEIDRLHDELSKARHDQSALTISSRHRITEPGDVLRIIYAMHWDMKACSCWVCDAARAFGCKGTTDDLGWRKDGFGWVTVKKSDHQVPQ